MARDTAKRGTLQRAGWLTTKAAGKPVPFAMEGGKLVCMTCEAAHADRDKFIGHGCTPAVAPPVEPTKKAGG